MQNCNNLVAKIAKVLEHSYFKVTKSMQIPEIIENALNKVAFQSAITVESCFATDKEARRIAMEMI